jgi:hypothetical protein
VASLVGQVDLLFVNFNAEKIPSWTSEFPNVRPLSCLVTRQFDANAKFWYADSAKFLGLKEFDTPPDIFCTVDDDIVYPKNYIEKMRSFMDKRPGSAVAVHGARIKQPFTGYHECLEKYRFAEALKEPKRVHIAGTGTLMFRPSEATIDFERMFGYPNMTDVWFALRAKELGVPIWIIDRRPLWLKPIKVNKGIYETRSHGWTWVENLLIREAGPWEKL